METTLPIRHPVRLERHVSLNAGPAAPAAARSQVRAAIWAWDIPVDLSIALLLTSELVTNAVTHEAGETILLTFTCGWGHLRVEVHDTSSAPPVLVDAPVDAETGRGLMLIASLSSDWGYYWTRAGKAVYFTLAFQADP
jgi:anti-sigma regulatory factor (Ser/Thr protein kinase)